MTLERRVFLVASPGWDCPGANLTLAAPPARLASRRRLSARPPSAWRDRAEALRERLDPLRSIIHPLLEPARSDMKESPLASKYYISHRLEERT